MGAFEVALHDDVSDSDAEEEEQETDAESPDNTDQEDLNNAVITFDKSLPGAHAVSI